MVKTTLLLIICVAMIGLIVACDNPFTVGKELLDDDVHGQVANSEEVTAIVELALVTIQPAQGERARTILPGTYPLLQFYTIVFTSGPGVPKASVVLEDTQCSLELEIGTWNLTVEARETESGPVVARASNVEMTVQAGTNQKTITLQPLREASGSVMFSLDWPDSITYDTIEAYLKPIGGSTQNFSFVPVDGVLRYSSTLLSGDYFLSITIQRDSVPLYILNEIIQVYDASTTSKDFVLSPESIRQAPTAPNALSITRVTADEIQISWVDNASVESGYIVSVSENDTLNYADVATVGFNVTTYTHADLQDSTTYFYTVRAYNAYGESALSNEVQATTNDVSAPVPGDSGAITLSDAQEQSLTIAWSEAADLITPAADLEYRVYWSRSNNIATYADAVANGTAACVWTTALTDQTIPNLDPGTDYYVNVCVRDQLLHTASYTAACFTTADNTEPVPGNSGISSVDTVHETSILISWDAASDIVSTQDQLEYLVFRSTVDMLGSFTDAQDNGTAVGDWQVDTTTKEITGLEAATDYFFNIFVRDEAGNIAPYTVGSATTIDETPPVPGNSGLISVDTVGTTTASLSWTISTDAITESSNLEYRVVASTSTNVDTVLAAEASDILNNGWTINLAGNSVEGLAEGTTYYFNVLVRDSAGNTGSYTMTQGVTTLETLGVTVQFVEPADELITLDESPDTIFGTSEVFDVVITEEFSAYVWHLNGAQLTAYDDLPSVTIDCGTLSLQTHWLVAYVQKDGTWYSKTLRFAVGN